MSQTLLLLNKRRSEMSNTKLLSFLFRLQGILSFFLFLFLSFILFLIVLPVAFSIYAPHALPILFNWITFKKPIATNTSASIIYIYIHIHYISVIRDNKVCRREKCWLFPLWNMIPPNTSKMVYLSTTKWLCYHNNRAHNDINNKWYVLMLMVLLIFVMS